MNDLRKDLILDRWVVIAENRSKRPCDFNKSELEEKASCPLCPGNEEMTPPAYLVFSKSLSGKIIVLRDGETREKNWAVRVFENLYPAFGPPDKESNAVGFHEVIVESPDHNEHPHKAKSSTLILLIRAYIERIRELYSKDYINYSLIFRNHGKGAGASLSHPHTQIISTKIIPRYVKEKLDVFNRFKDCPYCDIIKREKESERVFYRDDFFMVFCPYSSRSPFEFQVLPKRHMKSIIDMNDDEVISLAKIIKISLNALSKLIDEFLYNYWINIAPKNVEDFHWHIEVLPKTCIRAGFELGSGMYINTTSPEEAASALRGKLGNIGTYSL